MKKKKLCQMIRKARKDAHLTLRGIESISKGKLNNMWISNVETLGSYRASNRSCKFKNALHDFTS